MDEGRQYYYQEEVDIVIVVVAIAMKESVDSIVNFVAKGALASVAKTMIKATTTENTATTDIIAKSVIIIITMLTTTNTLNARMVHVSAVLSYY